MQPILFDTSVYISALRRDDASVLSARWLGKNAVLWLSAVVLEELYAGSYQRDRRVIEKLERDFDKASRILVPNLSDWSRAGRVLARFAEKYNYEHLGLARLANDTLIAMSAGRMGIKVMTSNERDFRRLAEFRPFQWEICEI